VITALKPLPPANAPETKDANLITMPAERWLKMRAMLMAGQRPW
jgi:hypothetical protein